jgi:hypothetical protein
MLVSPRFSRRYVRRWAPIEKVASDDLHFMAHCFIVTDIALPARGDVMGVMLADSYVRGNGIGADVRGRGTGLYGGRKSGLFKGEGSNIRMRPLSVWAAFFDRLL